jgi:hypothetical protein
MLFEVRGQGQGLHDLEPATVGQAVQPALAGAGDGGADPVDVRTTPLDK